MREEDSRHNKADFDEERATAPDDLVHLLDDIEFMAYRRREYEARGMIDEILRRGGVVLRHRARTRLCSVQ